MVRARGELVDGRRVEARRRDRRPRRRAGPHSNGFSLIRRRARAPRARWTTRRRLAADVADGCSSRRGSMPRAVRRCAARSTSARWRTSPAAASPATWPRRCPPASACGSTRRAGSGPRCSAGSPSLGVEEEEMRRVFNLGVGYIVVRARRIWPSWPLRALTAGRRDRRGCAGELVEGDGVVLPLRVGVLISGSGTNLQALIDAPDIEVACVVSSRADAGGLARAERGRPAGAGLGGRVGDARVPRTPRRRRRRARRLHAHPVAGLRSPVLRADPQRAPVAAAGLPRRHGRGGTPWRMASASPASPFT